MINHFDWRIRSREGANFPITLKGIQKKNLSQQKKDDRGGVLGGRATHVNRDRINFDSKQINIKKDWKVPVLSNLLRILNVGYINARRDWPQNVKFVFIELKQENNQHEQCVEHEEGEDWFVS